MYFKSSKSFNFLITPLLNGLSAGYKGVALIHMKLKSRHRQAYSQVKIISVDNLAFGGTGKTSMVIEIGRLLLEKKIKFAIVLRGYRSSLEKTGKKVDRNDTYHDVGDEAMLLKRRFPDQDIYIGKNRHQSIKLAIEDKNKVVVLDDGFQSTDIIKDCRVLLINPLQPYYYLRHFRFTRKYADVILYYNPLLSQNPPLPVDHYSFSFESFYDQAGNIYHPGQSSLLGFSALGDNKRFATDLKSFNLKKYIPFADHHRYSPNDLKNLEKIRQKENIDFLVCSEKDYIKIESLPLAKIPLLYCRNRLQCKLDFLTAIIDDATHKNSLQT